MNLEEIISNIGEFDKQKGYKELRELPKNGYAKTINDLWEQVIEPLLPTKEIMHKWFLLLTKYVKSEDSVYAICAFHDREKGNPESLRRGFYTKYKNCKNSFFYTDNYFAAYFAKMAISGYVPKLKEFSKMMKNKKFPARFGQYCKEEEKKAAYIINGKKDPKINKAGYKLSHIIDVGTNYKFRGKILSVKEICEDERCFPRGEYSDWKENKCRILYELRDDEKDFLKAHFLRLTCPLNYILTPKKDLQRFEYKIKGNDIGEYVVLQEYAKQKFIKKYDDYKKFLTLIMLPDNKYSKIKINLHYGTGNKVYNDLIKKFKDKGIGKFVQESFKKLILSNEINKKEIEKLLTKEYSKKVFGLYYPVLNENRIKNRYYSKPIGKYYLCKEWYDTNREKFVKWLINLNKVIQKEQYK